MDFLVKLYGHEENKLERVSNDFPHSTEIISIAHPPKSPEFRLSEKFIQNYVIVILYDRYWIFFWL